MAKLSKACIFGPECPFFVSLTIVCNIILSNTVIIAYRLAADLSRGRICSSSIHY
jgi:hypothetical protein